MFVSTRLTECVWSLIFVFLRFQGRWKCSGVPLSCHVAFSDGFFLLKPQRQVVTVWAKVYWCNLHLCLRFLFGQHRRYIHT